MSGFPSSLSICYFQQEGTRASWISKRMKRHSFPLTDFKTHVFEIVDFKPHVFEIHLVNQQVLFRFVSLGFKLVRVTRMGRCNWLIN